MQTHRRNLKSEVREAMAKLPVETKEWRQRNNFSLGKFLCPHSLVSEFGSTSAATLLLALLLPLGISRAAEFKPDRVVPYKTVGDVTLKLHVFEPTGLKTNDHRPAIVLFFGGGWAGGDPKQFFQQARALADLGMVAFSANYRVKSRNQTTPFECVKDAKSAIRWVRAHAAELGVDPNRIVAGGGSAGGHIAACTGLIAGSEEAGENLKISSRPNAMILFNPVLDTTEKGLARLSSSRINKPNYRPVIRCGKASGRP